jgi:TIR domain
VNEASRAVFLSYASQDTETAKHICNALRTAGVEVWFDQSELRGGDAWDASIRRQIRKCALFVPLISANTNARSEGYFRLERKLAVERSHLIADDRPFLLPLVIDDGTADVAARVPELFHQRQWVRLRDGQLSPEIIDRLVRLLTVSSAANATAEPMLTTNAIVPAAVYQASPGTGSSPTILGRRDEPESGTLNRLGVCVLPFANMSGDPEQDYFSDGITEDVITDLSKISALWVAARNTPSHSKARTWTCCEWRGNSRRAMCLRAASASPGTGCA